MVFDNNLIGFCSYANCIVYGVGEVDKWLKCSIVKLLKNGGEKIFKA